MCTVPLFVGALVAYIKKAAHYRGQPFFDLPHHLFDEQSTQTTASGTRRNLPIGISRPHLRHLP